MTGRILAVVWLACGAGAAVFIWFLLAPDPEWSGVAESVWPAVSMALFFLVFGAAFFQRGFRDVTLTEDGLETRGPFRNQSVRWTAIRQIRVIAVSYERASARLLPLVGHADGLIPVGDGRNPFEHDGEARAGLLPGAQVFTGRWARIDLPPHLAWEFYGDLLAEAQARGVPVRTVWEGA